MATKKSTTKRASGQSTSSRSASKKTNAGTRSRSGSSRASTDDENAKSRRASNTGTSRSTTATSRSTAGSPGRSSTRSNRSGSTASGRKGSTQPQSRSTSGSRTTSTGRGVSSNRGSGIRGNNYNEDFNYSGGRTRYGDGENYRNERSGYGDDYGYRRREDSMGWQGEEYGNRGRTNYGNDRDSGRNQDRYDNERNERRRSDTGMGWGPERHQGRSGYGSNRDAGSRSGRAFGGSTRGNTGNEEYYTENEWNRQRNQNWNWSDNQMEKDDDYRQERRPWRRSIIRPTGKNDEGLRKLLTDQLKDIYWAEKALTKAIPKMIRQASSADLRNALAEHLDVTDSHVQKVEEVFQLLGEKASAKKCEGMTGLIKEANEIYRELEEGSVRDAGIICAAQKAEHYEIATYGTLATYADILDEPEIADILEEILAEEKYADKTLTRVAIEINWEAAEESEEDEEEEEEEEDEEEDDVEEEEEEDDEEEEEEDGITRIKGSKQKKFSELDAVES